MVASHSKEGVYVSPASGRTRVLAVFGHPVEHSLSPAMHNAALAALRFDILYIPFSVPPDRLGPAIRSITALGIIGVNLTIPHKERALPFLDEVVPEAQAIGAVNTIHNDGGRLVGYNTDGEGFARPLAVAGFGVRGRRVVVLGAGGAARSVVNRLVRDGARVTIVNRTLARAAQLARDVATAVLGAPVRSLELDDRAGLERELAGAELLVNATSAGMHPLHEQPPPVPPEMLHQGLVVYDLVYNPMETALLKAAKAVGARTLSGVPMLAHQGAAALRIWTGAEAPVELMERVVREALAQREAKEPA